MEEKEREKEGSIGHSIAIPSWKPKLHSWTEFSVFAQLADSDSVYGTLPHICIIHK